MLVVGIDGGTESARAGVLDENGNCLGMSTQAYPTEFSQSGHAEQQPEDWWHAFGEASKQALRIAGASAGDIAAVCCCSTTCTVVALDANGKTLRPALLCMDIRAENQAKNVTATNDAALCHRCSRLGRMPCVRDSSDTAASPSSWLFSRALNARL